MQITMNDMAAINQVLNEHRNDKMPIKTAYKFNKLLTSFESDFKFFQEKYREILFKYCNKNEDGSLFINDSGDFIVEKENTEKYTADMTDLLSTPVEIPEIKFTLDELDGIEITVQEAASLKSIIME